MKNLPKSTCKHIRIEKARIRREISNTDEQKKLIDELYKKFFKNEELFVKKSEKGEAGVPDAK